MKAYLDPEDIEKLESHADNLRNRLLIHMLFRSGCRVSEALSLSTSDFDPMNQTIMIKHLKMRLKLTCPVCRARLGKAYCYCQACGSSVKETVREEREHIRQRVLPVAQDLSGMLQEYIRRGGPVLRDGKRLIFGINRHRAWQIVKECAEKAGLPKIINPETGKTHNVSPHRLRDSFAVHAVKLDDSGDGLRLLQEHLGHQSFNTTAKYRKISSKEHEEWYRKLWENNHGSATET